MSGITLENIEVKLIDYNNAQDGEHLVRLLNEYAEHPMGGGKPLGDEVKASLAEKLSEFGNAFSLIAYVDDEPAALMNCIKGFSTFKAKPLINIHDVVVSKDYRGHGLSRQLFERVEDIAREQGCCKLTLEVVDKNDVAKQAYRNFGFDGYELDAEHGRALFWEKSLL